MTSSPQVAQTYVTRKGCNAIAILMRALGERCTFNEMNMKDVPMTYFTGFVELICVASIWRDFQPLHKKLVFDVIFFIVVCPVITVGIGYGDRE